MQRGTNSLFNGFAGGKKTLLKPWNNLYVPHVTCCRDECYDDDRRISSCIPHTLCLYDTPGAWRPVGVAAIESTEYAFS